MDWRSARGYMFGGMERWWWEVMVGGWMGMYAASAVGYKVVREWIQGAVIGSRSMV